MSLWPEAFSLELVGALICGGGSYVLYKTLRHQQAVVAAMKAAPDLHSKNIVNQTGQVMLAGITGFYTGTVQPVFGEGLRSLSATTLPSTTSSTVNTTRDVTGVVSQNTVTEIILTKVFGIWSTNERVVSVDCQSIPFHIIDGNLKVQVRHPVELDYIDLQVVGETFEVPTSGLISSLMSILKGVHTTGIKNTQEMLVSGTEVVGLGRLVLKSSGFYLEADPTLPYVISNQTRETIIETYNCWLPYYKGGAIILGAVTCYFIVKMFRNHFKRAWQQWWHSTTSEARQHALSAAVGSENEDLPSRLTCVICYGLRNAVIIPCAHAATCIKCTDKLKTCPVCRNPIASVQPLIYS